MDNLRYIFIFFSSLVLSIIFVPVCMRAAVKFNVMDKPDNKLKKHKKPVPYLGGVAIFLSFFITLFVQRMWTVHTLKGLVGVISGGTLIFLLGLTDDIKKLSIPFKFIVQILASVTLIIFGIKIEFLGNEVLNILVTVLWVVGITNSFNLLDIMDGLASGVAFISSATFFVIGIEGGKLFSPLSSLALAGSVLGFLIYNFPPAKIFMGDAGSLFLGFMLASLSLTESYTYTNNFAVLTPLLLLGVPIFDTLFVMWMRVKQHKPVYFGSPDHFPLRLLRLGLSNKKVILMIYIVSFALALLGYISIKLSESLTVILYLIVFTSCILSARKLSKTP